MLQSDNMLTTSRIERARPSASVVACQNACSGVVARACISCSGNPGCLVGCQTARRKSCIARRRSSSTPC
jgi:hypothetical protein